MSDGLQAATEVVAATQTFAQPAPVAVPAYAPTAPAPVAAQMQAPVAAPAPAAVPEQDPPWLPKRLERAREGGFKEAEARFKSEIEQREAKLSELTGKVAEYNKTLADFATETLGSLSEVQRQAVLLVAKDDPRKQLETVKALRPTWQSAAPSPPPAAAPAPLPAPASTAVAQPAPAPATPTAPNHHAVWQQLKTTNPIRAAQYLLAHQAEIVKAANRQ